DRGELAAGELQFAPLDQALRIEVVAPGREHPAADAHADAVDRGHARVHRRRAHAAHGRPPALPGRHPVGAHGPLPACSIACSVVAATAVWRGPGSRRVDATQDALATIRGAPGRVESHGRHPRRPGLCWGAIGCPEAEAGDAATWFPGPGRTR